MKSTGEWTADVIIFALMVLYICYASTHTLAMWKMRRTFLIAVRCDLFAWSWFPPTLPCRSPLFACICGACRVGRCFTAVYSEIFVNGLEQNTATFVGTAITAPAVLVSNSALIAWMIRLLVLYDPRRRKSWGHHFNEKRVARALCWIYAGIVVAFLIGAAVDGGIDRIVLLANLLDVLAVILAVMALTTLAGKMRKVRDIDGVSRDARYLGAYLIAMFLFGGAIVGTPGMPSIFVKFWVLLFTISDMVLVSWTINIKPVREFLRNTNDETHRTLSSWIFSEQSGGKGNPSRVACASPGSVLAPAATRRPGSFYTQVDTKCPLAIIMGFFPLKQAFEEFCQRALCSESFQFLVDASEYQSTVLASDETCYEEFIAIVNEYIKDSSISEINIDSGTKKRILAFEQRPSYATLSMEGRSEVFLPAQREITKMLAENLVWKFKATAEYEEVAGDLLFEGA